MYQLFNVFAWIWIVVNGLCLALATAAFIRRMIKGWPVSWPLMITPYGKLYGKVWIPCLAAIIAALTVDFDPTLQVWVVGLSVAYMVLRAIDTALLKGANHVP